MGYTYHIKMLDNTAADAHFVNILDKMSVRLNWPFETLGAKVGTPLIRFAFLAVVFAVGACASAGSAEPPDTQLPGFVENQLDQYVDDAIRRWRVPGLALVIVKAGKVQVARGYGNRRIGEETPVDADTLFLLGSTTKAFTAAAIANLATEAAFDLDEPVRKFLPQFALSDEWLTENVSVQDLMAHRSGLSTFQGDFIFYDSDLTKSEIIEALGKIEITNTYREFGYTNVGYFLLGEIIAALSGVTYDNYIQKVFFDRLHMSRSVVNPNANWADDNRAAPYTVVSGEIRSRDVGDFSNMAAAGGIATSARDIGNWLIAQLQNGKFEDGEVFPPQVIEITRQPQIFVGRATPPYTIFGESNFELYSSGWYHIDYEGLEIVTHNGGSYGFSSSVTLIPELDVGIAILTNSDAHLLFETIKLELIDAFMGLPPRNYSSAAHGFFLAQEERKAARINDILALVESAPDLTIPLSSYSGVYNNAAYGEIVISVEGDRLKLTFERHPDLFGTLRLIEDGQFFCVFNKPIYGSSVISFEFDRKKVTHMTFRVDENVEPNAYKFTKQQ